MATIADESRNVAAIRALLSQVCDPELPMMTIEDMGILRAVEETPSGFRVTITPTYSGCPAMNTIANDIRRTLNEHGLADVELVEQLAPAWTTDWMSAEGRRKLREAGIAPPAEATTDKRHLLGITPVIECPNCGSKATERVSEFGSTACKALYRCTQCLEPFDYFKCI